MLILDSLQCLFTAVSFVCMFVCLFWEVTELRSDVTGADIFCELSNLQKLGVRISSYQTCFIITDQSPPVTAIQNSLWEK